MNKNKQTWNGLIDAVLLIAFLAEFYLDLTGVSIHQWMGITIGALIGYHLLAHWSWVKSVTRRFFDQAPQRAIEFYVLDATLLLGFALILLTGLAISTWLNLSLANYAVWKTLFKDKAQHVRAKTNFHLICTQL